MTGRQAWSLEELGRIRAFTDAEATTEGRDIQAASDKQTLLATATRLAERDPITLARGLTLATLLIVFAAYLPQVTGGAWGLFARNTALHLYLLLWLLAASFRVRTAGPLDVLVAGLVGFFFTATLSYSLTEPMEQILGTGSFQTALWVPVVEEVVKALPLVAYAALVMRGRRLVFTIVDLAILGFAVGAGFAIHEEALWTRSVASGFAGPGSFPWDPLFPTFMQGSPFVIAHAGWTGLVGLGIGFSLWRRPRRWALLPAVAALLLATLDHASINLGSSWDFLSGALLNGRLAAYLLVVGLVAALILDHFSLLGIRRADEVLPSITAQRLTTIAREKDWDRAWAAVRYQRLLTGLHAHLAWRKDTQENQPTHAALERLLRLARRADLPSPNVHRRS